MKTIKRTLQIIIILLAMAGSGGLTAAHPAVQAAPNSPSRIYTTPDDTQNFFKPYGYSTVSLDDQGRWAQVNLTDDQQFKGGAVSLNSRVDLSQPFTLKMGIKLGKYSSEMGDGMSFGMYPGQIGAVGMFGGNLGMGAIRNMIGFKVDDYVNRDDNGGDDPALSALLKGVGLTTMPDLDPVTQTVQYAQFFQEKNHESKYVFGSLDTKLYVDSEISVPYFGLVETTNTGYVWTPGNLHNNENPSNYYGGGIGGFRATPMPDASLHDNQWHGMTIVYTVGPDVGTFTFNLYTQFRSDGAYESLKPKLTFTRTINMATMKRNTAATYKAAPGTDAPYLAMNIAGSTGKFTAVQQIKNIYAEYTPEPYAVTARFVDENGKNLQDTQNFGDFQTQSGPFDLKVPETLTDADGNTYKFDYANYEKYTYTSATDPRVVSKLPVATAKPAPSDAPNGAVVRPGDSGDYTYYGQYLKPYQRIINHYRRDQSQPTISTAISVKGVNTEQTPVGTSGHDFLNHVAIERNTKMTYTFKVTAPATGPNPWKGVTLTVKVPQGYTVSPTAVTAEALADTAPTSVSPTITRSSDPSDHASVLTISGVDLSGILKDANGTVQPNTLLVTVPITASGDTTTGIIRATLDDTYLMDYTTPATTDAEKKTNYYTGYPVTYTNALNEADPGLVTNVWIPLTDRTTEKHDFTAAELHMPAGVVLNPAAGSMAYLPVNDTPPDHTVRLTAADIVPAAVTGSANLLGGFTLTDSGIQKLKANDYVKAAFQFTGTNGTKTTKWQVDYNLYEPLTTWMPDTGLQQLVQTAFAQPVTIDPDFISGGTPVTNTRLTHPTDHYPNGELRKSDMSGLKALTNAAPTIGHPQNTTGTTAWNLRNDPTGLEYATTLQALAIYGEKLLANTTVTHPQTNGTFRSLLPVLPKSLVTLDLSGYDRSQDVFAHQAAALADTTVTFSNLANFNLVANELVSADLQTTDAQGRYSDVAQFYVQNVPNGAFKQTNLSSLAEPGKLTNQKNVNKLGPVVTDSHRGVIINQKNMLIAPALDIPLTNTAGQLEMTLPVTNLKKLAQQSFGQASQPTLPAGNDPNLNAYDLAHSDAGGGNAHFTTFFTGDGTVPYTDYTVNTHTNSGTFYIQRALTFTAAGATTNYSSWTPATFQSLTAMTVTPDNLDFGTRLLRAGDFANTGYDETSHTTPEAAEGTPVTITVTKSGGPTAASGQLTAAASPFVGGTSTLATWHLRFTDTAAGTAYSVPANSTAGNNNPTTLSPITFPTATPATGTSAYHVRLVVPDTTGILTGKEQYTANLVYTYMPNTL
ncbi:lectin-like domain-containing protein [Schleiferilactobacillus shenzhenensis]|nr:hypothetical protein [Schleiferilactobacillus shenzhenensis]